MMSCPKLPAPRVAAAPAIAGFQPAAAVLALAAAFSSPAHAQPSGGVAVHGTASFARDGNKLVVTTQNGAGTRHSAINWQSFSIPAGQVTQFVQPSAASTSINRVLGNDPSRIFGTLSSNGRLVLVNPAGIAVGAGAVVNTAAFTASTLRMSDADALAGRLAFGDGSPAGRLEVDGHVLARSGDVVLIAPNVQAGANALIQSPNGATLLAAGQRVALTGRGLEGIRLELQAPDNSAVNLGTLSGDAVGMFAGTLKHSGLIVASAVSAEGGKVVLRGQVEADLAGTIRAQQGARGGQVHATAAKLILREGAVVDVSGAAGGGEALLGGGWQGQDARLANARDTVVEAGSLVRANAADAGNGGTVVVWADGTAFMGGRIEAKGGAAGGNGGAVETSGKKRLVFRGQVDTSAPRGTAGTVLLDPQDIIIANGTGAVDDASLADSIIDGSDADGVTDVTISEAALENNAIVGSSITLQASRDVIFQDLADNLLDLSTVTAGTSFVIQAGGSIKHAPVGGDSNDRIRTNGGAIQFSTTNGAIDLGGVITRGGSVNMSAGGALGDIRLREVNTVAGSGSGGAVTLIANGSGPMLLGGIDARLAGSGTSGAVTLQAQGALRTAAGSRIHAGHLQISANGGITDDAGAAMGTSATSLNAINNGGGNILVANNGALDIADPNATGYGVRQAGGSGRIAVATTGGGLNVNANVLAQGGDISLTSPDTGVRVLGSTIAAAGGNVLISASGSNDRHSVEIANNGATRSAVTTTGTGTVTINGNLTGGGTGSGSAASGVVISNSTVSAGTGAIAIDGRVTNGVSVQSRGFQLNSGAIVSGAGAVTLSGQARSTATSGSAGGEIANGATVASSGGNVVLQGTFANPSAFTGVGLGVNGRVQASAGSITLQGQATVGPSAGQGVLVGATAALDAGALGFTVTGTVSSSTTATSVIAVDLDGLMTSSGNIAITGTVAAPSASGTTGVRTSGSVVATGAATITITGSGTPAPAPASSYDVRLEGTTVASAGGQIKLVGDRMGIHSPVNAGTGDVVITPFTTNREITLGGPFETSALNLSNSELNMITAGTIVVGDALNTGGISLGNSGGAVNVFGASQLSLLTFGAITQSASLTVTRLRAEGASVALDNAANQFAVATGRALLGNFSLRSASAFEVGSMAGANGIRGRVGGTVTVQSAGMLSVSSSIAAAGGTLALRGNGISLGPGSALAASNVALDGTGPGALNLGGGTVLADGSIQLANGSSATLGNVVGGGNLTLDNLSGLVSQAASTTLDVGTLSGSGNLGTLLLANAGNQVDAIGPLAMGNGLTVRDAAGDLAIAGPVAGGSGPVLVTTAGNLTQSQSVTSNAGGDAVVLAAGGNYANTAGTGAIATPVGRWLVYSANPAANAFGGLASGNTAVFNATYASTPPAGIAAGNRYVFAYQPTVTVTVDAQSRVYDGTAGFGALTYAATPAVDASAYGNVFLQDSFTGALALGSSSRNVGSYAIVQGSLGTNSGYALTYNGANASITPASLVLAAAGDTRVYNGLAGSSQAVATSGLVGGDTVSSLTQSFDSRNVLGTNGSTLRVDAGYVVDDGNGGANYTVSTSTATGTITPASLVLSAVGDSRVYDGSTGSAPGPLSSGLVGGDTVSSLTQSFASRNVLGTNGSTLQVDSGYVLNDGNGGANYTVARNTATGTITPAALSLAAVTDTRAYDGTTGSSQAVATSGLVGGDTVSSLAQSFASKNVLGTNGSTLQVNAGYVVNDGNGGANYSVGTSTATGTITPAPLTIGAEDISRVYDGGTAASGTAAVRGGTLFTGDSLAGGNFSFADRHVGTGKTVTVGGVTVNDGNGGANYSVSYAANTGSSITQRPLSTWTGAAGDGLWSSAGNWDALPDASNVLAVSIPAGAFVTYDLSGLTSLASLASAGGLGIASGTLEVAESARTQSYQQTGGLLSGAGSLLVTEFFAQHGGAIDLGGSVDITQAAGNLELGSVRAAGISLKAANGSIAFTSAGPLTVGAGGIAAMGDIVLVASNHADPGHMTLEGDVVSSAGAVRLTAGGDLVQNQWVRGANGVFVTAQGAIRFGPAAGTAGSPISYTAAGQPVSPPTGQPAPSGPLQQVVQRQNQQVVADLAQIKAFTALFRDELERQRLERIRAGAATPTPPAAEVRPAP